MKVAVYGSWRIDAGPRPRRARTTFDLLGSEAEFRRAGMLIGERLIERGHRIIVATSAEHSLDRAVLDGALRFLSAKPARSESPIIWLDRQDGVHDRFFRSTDAAHPGLLRPLPAAIPRPALTYHPEPLAAADATVFVAGVGGTYDAGHSAVLVSARPLVFVGSFGGASALLAREQQQRAPAPTEELLARLRGAWTDSLAEMICEFLEGDVSVTDLVLGYLVQKTDRSRILSSHTDQVAGELGHGLVGAEVHAALLDLRDAGAVRDLYVEGGGTFSVTVPRSVRAGGRSEVPIHHHHYGDTHMGDKFNTSISNSNVGAAAIGAGAHATGSVTLELTQEAHREKIKAAQRALVNDQDVLEKLDARMFDALNQFLRLARDIQVEQANLADVQTKMKSTLDDVWAEQMAKGMKPQLLPKALEVAGAIAANPVMAEVAKSLISQ